MNKIEQLKKDYPIAQEIINQRVEYWFQLDLGNGLVKYAKYDGVWYAVDFENDPSSYLVISKVHWVCTLSEYEALEAKLKPKTLKLSNKMRVIEITGDTKCELSHDEIAEIIQDVLYDLGGQRRTDAGLKLKELLQKLTS